MSRNRRVLISGASIAGTCAAWWLARFGWDVTVVERAPAFRDGGQNIDVRGAGRDVLRRMGLEDAALARHTTEQGTAWIDARGAVAAQFVTAELDGDGPTAELEILRGDLARLLYDASRKDVDYRFGTTIAALRQDAAGVDVTFDDDTTERFDAVVIAEGVGSASRERLMPGANDPRWMNLTIAYFTIPRTSNDDRMWRWYNATGGRSISLRPDPYGTTRAMLSVQQPPGGEQNWSEERQRAWLHARFADAGWQAGRVLAGMDRTDDFYFDVLRQVRLPHWSEGRIALTGDAAWCVTPIAGMGATLAIVGGYVLAGELSRSHEPASGLASYERIMRPRVDKARRVPKLGPRLMNPHSRAGIGLLHRTLWLASRPTVRRLAQKVLGGGAEPAPLPDYPL